MPEKLYTLDVWVIGGPMTEAFVKANPTVGRTIEIRGDQTLEDLHRAIFRALDREEEHMYEFQFGDRPHDPDAPRYGIGGAVVDAWGDDESLAGDVAETTIDLLDLAVDRCFGYWFDFGDDWWHQIDVVAIGEAEGDTQYPRVAKRVGESPPQYVDWEEEDEDYDEEDEEE